MRAALVVLAACGAAPLARPAPTSRLAVPAQVGNVVAVEEIGDTTFVLDEHRAYVVRGGVVAAVSEAPHGWRGGAPLAAPDGDGRWAVGVDRDGRLWRITIAGELEDVSERFALGDAKVAAIAGAGTTSAFALGDGVAYSTDGVHLDRTRLAPPTAIAAAKDRLALLRAGGVDVWDLAHGTMRGYAIPGARAVAFAGGKLAVATGRTLWLEDGGALHAIAAPGPIAAIAGGARLWLAAGALYAVDGRALRKTDAALPAAPRLFASQGGDVWLGTTGSLARASIDRAIADPAWQASVEPVFQRVCAHCHLPGGEAGIDLSTAASWNDERAEITRRVLVTRTMPPAGTELSDADRDALARWLGAK
ncbi:MAG TPA: cytochrome c [Kofleriaceae bacterium]|nr:cytochrome c [Kofleriaceae bacterium]